MEKKRAAQRDVQWADWTAVMTAAQTAVMMAGSRAVLMADWRAVLWVVPRDDWTAETRAGLSVAPMADPLAD